MHAQQTNNRANTLSDRQIDRHLHENYVYAALEPQTKNLLYIEPRLSCIGAEHYALAVAATNPNIMPKSYN